MERHMLLLLGYFFEEDEGVDYDIYLSAIRLRLDEQQSSPFIGFHPLNYYHSYCYILWFSILGNIELDRVFFVQEKERGWWN